MKKTRILLADDHEIVRQGLKALFEKQNDMEVIGEVSSGREAVKLAYSLNPDLIVMDVTMPDLNGIEATRMIKEELPHIKIVALSMHSDKRFVLGMMKAGVSGFLLKESAFKELVAAAEAAMSDQIYLSPRIAGSVIEDFMHCLSATEISASYLLTGREREVLQLIAEGHKTREIAAKLAVSVKTIEARRKKIMEKLNLPNIAALIKFALREGIASMDS